MIASRGDMEGNRPSLARYVPNSRIMRENDSPRSSGGVAAPIFWPFTAPAMNVGSTYSSGIEFTPAAQQKARFGAGRLADGDRFVEREELDIFDSGERGGDRLLIPVLHRCGRRRFAVAGDGRRWRDERLPGAAAIRGAQDDAVRLPRKRDRPATRDPTDAIAEETDRIERASNAALLQGPSLAS